jgi:hypothetical protein
MTMNDLEKLIERMLAGELSNEETKQLETLLENDPVARRQYVEQCQLHAQLMSNAELKPLLKAEELIDAESPVAVESEEQPIVAEVASSGWPWRVVIATAAMSALVVFTALQWSSAREDRVTDAAMVASITPEAAYEQADFSDSGSLNRPPTNFAVVAPGGKPGGPISFNRDVRPILSENCYHCHGPDANTRKAELRLDVEANAFAPHGEFAAPIVRGDPKASPLYQRITSSLKSEIMPPLDSHKSLTVVEKEIIRDWIVQGAKWEGHWAFGQPRKVEPAPSEWGNGAIDGFIAMKHSELGLAPNPEADRATMARRLSLDLTGLPSRPEQVAEFVTDERPDAYERYVDLLLASPAYGEHQARYWLDAARYADTHGLHLDNYREIWPYRDWVVQAFNRNQPYDEFTVEQIAGDLLPDPTESQLLATGFSRCSPTTSEGGAIEDEYRAIYAKDRAETAATVYLGLTVGCAACHDHKFDPISQKDFYAFSAFFNNIDGPVMDGNAYDTRPNLVMPKPEHRTEWPKIRDAFDESRAKLDTLKMEREAAFEAWLAAGEFEGTLPELAEAELKVEIPPMSKGEDRLLIIDLPSEIQAWNRDQPFTLVLDVKLPKLEAGTEKLLASKFDGDRGWRMFVLPGDHNQSDRYRLRFELIHSLAKGELIALTTKSRRYIPLRVGKRLPLVVSYDGSGRAAGLLLGAPDRLTLDGELVVDNLRGDFATAGDLVINQRPVAPEVMIEGETTEAEGGDEIEVNSVAPPMELSLYASARPLFLLGRLNEIQRFSDIYEKTEVDRSKRDLSQLKSFYFDLIDPLYRAGRIDHAALEARYQYIYDQATISLIMKEKEEAAIAHILDRGEYDKQGEEVAANVPEVLGGLTDELPKNRLGLAQWLVADENPLMARVTVNRIWQNLFGTGLVETAEDFGLMGDNPSHPKLLDWLAVDFRQNGWDVKGLIKQIVTSKTYRQDARIETAEYAVDPDNRFLARGPRYRLDAEVIRDQALFVSGALQDRQGGAPVRPYQPVGIWNAVAYSGSNTRYYHEDKGEGLYRRSLYTFWKRTAPPPNMTTFDAPSRENCSVRRDRTNTPLQALILMNDPQFVEAARLLAQRALAAPDLSVTGQIGAMYRYAFGTAAPELHGKILAESYRKFEAEFRRDPAEAAKLVSYGQTPAMESDDVASYASLTMVASQIMNLDSFINKY